MNHSQKIITKCDSLVYYKVRWTVITNCDSFFITKCDTVYYKLRQVLQSAMDLLQIATGITKCDDYYKLRQYICQDIKFNSSLAFLVVVKKHPQWVQKGKKMFLFLFTGFFTFPSLLVQMRGFNYLQVV